VNLNLEPDICEEAGRFGEDSEQVTHVDPYSKDLGDIGWFMAYPNVYYRVLLYLSSKLRNLSPPELDINGPRRQGVSRNGKGGARKSVRDRSVSQLKHH
jgi:hypothetical protein